MVPGESLITLLSAGESWVSACRVLGTITCEGHKTVREHPKETCEDGEGTQGSGYSPKLELRERFGQCSQIQGLQSQEMGLTLCGSLPTWDVL